MNKYSKSRNGFIHLYNPEKEGLGSYDVNYINAYNRNKSVKDNLEKKNRERYAAWFHLLEVFQN